MDLQHVSAAPCREFLFGTDAMGRDIFSMIWYGGRISLAIGVLATAISTVIAVVLGALSGSAPVWLDNLLMRLTEISVERTEPAARGADSGDSGQGHGLDASHSSSA